jgi:hypothetical protein
VPADRTLAEGLADALVELYGNAAVRIADDMARRLKAGINSPSWAADKLGSINDLRNAVRQVIDKLHADSTGLADQAVTLAFARGGKAAMDELAKSGHLTAEQLAAIRHSLGATEAVNRLAYSLVSTLRGTHLRILRWSLDSYREVIAKTAAPAVLLGTKSRLAAAQTAWDELLSRGITGFVDKSGRRWQLASYVEMATRTTVAQAAIEGHNDKLNDAGIDLRMISNAPQECIKCRPWEGKVLTTSGPPGKRTIRRQSLVSDEWIDVHIAGTLDEAIAAGLFHPNCRHSSNAYLPGATKPIEHTEDPEGDEARQKLRALERKVRENKLKAQAVIDPAARKQFEAKVRAYQQQIRDHVADTSVTTLFRQRHREQIGTAR